MNNKLKKDWDELVVAANAGCGALLVQYEPVIIAADQLIKEQ